MFEVPTRSAGPTSQIPNSQLSPMNEWGGSAVDFRLQFQALELCYRAPASVIAFEAMRSLLILDLCIIFDAFLGCLGRLGGGLPPG